MTKELKDQIAKILNEVSNHKITTDFAVNTIEAYVDHALYNKGKEVSVKDHKEDIRMLEEHTTKLEQSIWENGKDTVELKRKLTIAVDVINEVRRFCAPLVIDQFDDALKKIGEIK